jgi:hypothetical protein
MRRLIRELIAEIRKAGGLEIHISEGGRHTHVHFRCCDGDHQRVVVHRGDKVKSYYPGRMRSQVRRKTKGKAKQP